jgi:hypothetical protein
MKNPGGTATSGTYVSITPTEWRRVVVWGGIILILTSLPVIVGYLMPDEAYVFTGAAHHPEDVMSYLAKMRQGYDGVWAARLPYAVESHPGITLLYLLYTLLGRVARWTGFSLPLLYHMARVVCAGFLLWTIYRFIAFILPKPDWRWTAFLLATVASGFGVWAVLLAGSFTLGGITPIDLWPLDFYTFALWFLSPHQTLGIALFLIILQSVVTYWETLEPRRLIPGVVAALVEGFIFPFVPLVYGTTLAIAWLWERRWRTAPLSTAGAVILVVILPLPSVINYWFGLRGHPVWVSFSSQNLTLSPPIWHYILGYGLVGILALPGGWWAWRDGARGRLAVILVVVSLVLAYLPANFQRRLISGAHIPMCALAAAGIHGWLLPLWGRWRPVSGKKMAYRENLTRMGVVAFSAISSLYVWLSILISVLAYAPGIYMPADAAVGIRWLGSGTSSGAAVFSAYTTGTVIPAYTGRRVFWGHALETPYLPRKSAEARQFFSGGTSDVDRRAMLERYGITHLFYGPDEREMGDFDPESAVYLQPVFRHNTVTIYEVMEPEDQED